jgi:hypothetical protein
MLSNELKHIKDTSENLLDNSPVSGIAEGKTLFNATFGNKNIDSYPVSGEVKLLSPPALDSDIERLLASGALPTPCRQSTSSFRTEPRTSHCARYCGKYCDENARVSPIRSATKSRLSKSPRRQPMASLPLNSAIV